MAKEYIERSEALNAIERSYWPEFAYDRVEQLPAADVVEVTRCRDCKHGIWDEDEQKYKCVYFADYEPTIGEWYGFVSYEEADFYCGRGERRDNEC